MPYAIQPAVDYLDENRPGWWNEVSIEDLNIQSAWDCVLAQIAKSADFRDHCYFSGRDLIGMPHEMASEFCCGWQEEWEEVLKARQNAPEKEEIICLVHEGNVVLATKDQQEVDKWLEVAEALVQDIVVNTVEVK